MISPHIIHNNIKVKEALTKLNELDGNNILFIINENGNLVGSISDGDIRRGLIKGLNLNSPLEEFANREVKFLNLKEFKFKEFLKLKRQKILIIPILKDNKIYKIINLKLSKSFLPVDAIIMAGGKGTRLKPITNSIPKPLIKIGGKPIIDYNVERLLSFGIERINVSINYLGSKIEKHFKEKNAEEVNCFWESQALGTIGSAGLVKDFLYNHVLVMNSDILTNIDFEGFFIEYINSGADMAVASYPYNVYIPYAVMDLKDSIVKGFTEKPEYRFYTNAGIYLIKTEILKKFVKGDAYFNATDLMEKIIDSGGAIYSYSMKEYWLDIGKHRDLEKANVDINTIKF